MSDINVTSSKYLQHMIFNGFDAIVKSNIPPGYMKTLSVVEQRALTDEVIEKIKRHGDYEYRIANKIPFVIHVDLKKPTVNPIDELPPP